MKSLVQVFVLSSLSLLLTGCICIVKPCCCHGTSGCCDHEFGKAEPPRTLVRDSLDRPEHLLAYVRADGSGTYMLFSAQPRVDDRLASRLKGPVHLFETKEGLWSAVNALAVREGDVALRSNSVCGPKTFCTAGTCEQVGPALWKTTIVHHSLGCIPSDNEDDECVDTFLKSCTFRLYTDSACTTLAENGESYRHDWVCDTSSF